MSAHAHNGRRQHALLSQRSYKVQAPRTDFLMAPATFLDPSTALDVLKGYARSDGLSVAELMDSTKHGGLTYNDFLMLPGHIDFAASVVVTESRITRNVVLKTPFMSSPMDTVTESEMAIALAVSIYSSLTPPLALFTSCHLHILRYAMHGY
jgi:hypothetical protein